MHDERWRRCETKPKITRHGVELRDGCGAGEDLKHVGAIALRVLEGVASSAEAVSGSYEERECPWCFEGLTYDEQRGEWVACERCEGSGRALVFVYSKKRRFRECAGCGEWLEGRELIELDEDNHDNLTYFHGDLLCRECAGASGVL